jgi:serine carboxypeptidase-like clade 1
MVGNGCTNWDFDTNPAYVEMGFWHGLYDMDMYDNIHANDCISQYGAFSTDITPTCQGYLDTFNDLTSSINIYDVYGICYMNGGAENQDSDKFELYSTSNLGMAKVGDEIKTYKKSYTAADYTPWIYHNKESNKKLKELPPCTFGNPLIAYMNNATTRAAMNIPSTVGAWDFCTDKINYHIGTQGSQWIYSELKGLYRILFYSGDTDGAVPTYGSLQWIEQLGWSITAQWRAYMVDNQVAGYIEQRDGMTFATVHGAGHMVPQDKREQAYYLIFNWLNGQAI